MSADPTPDIAPPSRALRCHLLITDLGFLLYWTVSAAGWLPADWLYKDHAHPILMAWNASFAPLDLLASATGLAALLRARGGQRPWQPLALVSLSLTFAAGLMAIAFWALRRDVDPAWWLPNLYLILWPLGFVRPWLVARPAR